jgi:glycosyltransferase involved in cell wall biosynthesis
MPEMRVLHLPSDVGGNAFGLSRAERKLGLVSDTLYRHGNYFDYPADIVLSKASSKPLALIAASLAAFRLPQKYDVLHFNFSSSLIDAARLNINHWDLPLYKKQKLFVTCNGSDARLSFGAMYPGKAQRQDYVGVDDPLYASAGKERRIKKRLSQFTSYGARFFALNPDLLRALPAGSVFLPYTIANFSDLKAAPFLPQAHKIKIVHAPTNRIIKGTDYILSAVRALQKRYPDKIELRLVERLGNEEAINIYMGADIIIDQLRIGWYGAFAVEAMAMCKPVIAYINEDDLRYVPSQMAKDCKEALIRADCDTIESVLEHCVFDDKFLADKALAGLNYVHRWHDPIKVAQCTKAAYEET